MTEASKLGQQSEYWRIAPTRLALEIKSFHTELIVSLLTTFSTSTGTRRARHYREQKQTLEWRVQNRESHFSSFLSSVGLTWFCSLCLVIDAKKLDPTSQPSKASRELVTRVFPCFRQFACFYFAVLLAACDTCLSFDWLL